MIALTKKGREEFSKMNANSNRLIAQIIERLSPQQTAELVGMMERIEELLKRQPG
jgi:DNA-binding MarR family transcriptional regulator